MAFNNGLAPSTAKEHSSGCGRCTMIHGSLTSTSLTKFGFTRQYIAQLAKGLGVDGTRRRRQRERVLHRQLRVIKVEYPPSIRAVINKIRRSGNQVTPYVFPIQPSAPDRARKSQTMVVVSGSLCTIQFRKGRKLRPKGREYARFDTSVRTKRGNLLYGQ